MRDLLKGLSDDNLPNYIQLLAVREQIELFKLKSIECQEEAIILLSSWKSYKLVKNHIYKKQDYQCIYKRVRSERGLSCK